MLILLITILVGIVLFEYILFNKEICSPPILFTVPFIIACIIAQINSSTWSFQLNANTFWVILTGILTFFLGAYSMKRIKLYNCGKNMSVVDDRDVELWKFILLFLFQAGCYIWKIKCLQDYGISNGLGNDLSKTLVLVNDTAKFTTDTNISYPKLLSIGWSVCTALGFVWACMLARILILPKKERKYLILVIINFAVSVCGSLLSGGRGGAIQFIFAFLGVYLILYSRMHKWKRSVPLKYIVRVGVGIVLAGVGFFSVITLIGRYEVHLIWDYLSNYIGAQIYNLDHFLNIDYRNSEIFGQETFQPLVQYISGNLGIEKWSRYNLDLPSIYANGRSLGNVCTTFYAYIHDFGYIGVVILPFIAGMISQIVYRYAKYSNTTYTLNLGLLIYSNMIYILVFSYFSNKFYELFFTIDMIKKMFLIWIIKFFIYDFKIENSKLKVRFFRRISVK